MLIELLREGAAENPEAPLLQGPAATLSYGEALSQAEALARGLNLRGITRFAAVVTDPTSLLPLLAGASLVGSEACVLRPSADEPMIDDLVARFELPVVITDRPLRLEQAPALAVADLAVGDGDPPPAAANTPVLILTTGTTGVPKAARHEWSRMVKTARANASGAGERWLLAYNLNQFAGFQIMVHVFASHGTLVAPASNQPGDVVAAMRTFGVTHASATPTMWRFVVSHVDESVAHEFELRQITLGGEPVPGPLLTRLRSLFPGARISQVYASTEFGTALSVRDGLPGLPVSVLERPDAADVRFRITDGQLEACSRIGMLGYHGESDPSTDWRPTGDLVEVHGDRILFVGRATDTINVGGVKVHPLPVEELISALPGIKLVRVYGRASPVTGQIVAADVVPEPGADTAALDRAIRAACAGLGPAAQPRRIRFVEEIELAGEKIRRSPVPT